MILRAIIENQEDSYHYKIRIPVLNKSKDAVSATPYDELYTATVCTFPGFKVNYVVGDVVFVDFEKDRQELPVILGQLYRTATTDSVTDIVTDSVVCKVDFNVQGDLNITDKARDDFNSLVEEVTDTAIIPSGGGGGSGDGKQCKFTVVDGVLEIEYVEVNDSDEKE